MTSPDPYRTAAFPPLDGAPPSPYPRVIADDSAQRVVQIKEMEFVVETSIKDAMGGSAWQTRRTLKPKVPTPQGGVSMVGHHDGCEDLERWLCEQLASLRDAIGDLP